VTAFRRSLVDHLLVAADEALRTLSGAGSAARESPARGQPEGGAREFSAGLMRVNHTGEICAQALYSGQSLVARDAVIRDALQKAAAEERDHLAWCRGRLSELGARPSVLDPLWYAGSFALGVASGLAPAQVERAIRLSRDKYCSATAMMAKTAEVTSDFEIREAGAPQT